MKYTLFALFVALLASCQQTSAPSTQHQDGHSHEQETTTPATAAAVSLDVDTDPVCDMSVKAASAADTTLYQGKVYGFCNVHCKEKFQADPEKYVSR